MIEQSVMEVERADESAALPEHLLRLPDGRSAIWRWAGLRGAGFPAEQILELATVECATAADRLLQAEEELIQAQDTARGALYQDLRELPAGTEQRKAVQKALHRVNKGKLPEALEFAGVGQAGVETFRQARLKAAAARLDFEQAFHAALDHISQVVYRVAGTDRFREAVTWQNRRALLTGVDPILRTPPGTAVRDSQRRQHEELVVNYLQRYCIKNDTIGFFGPVGWARFVSAGPALIARPGSDLLASRQIYFEGWGIDTLAETLGRNKALRPWIAPRRIPSIDLQGTTLYLPFKDPVEIPPKQASLLQACHGSQTAHGIAQQLLRTPSSGFEDEAEIYDLLEELHRVGLIVWALEVPLETHPERALRRLLERIDDERLRQLNLRALDVLEKARAGVAQAAGDVEKLNQALGVIDTTFTRLTGLPSTRAAGQTYAARTLVYEDCRRNIEVEIGPEVLQALSRPLSLLLESARWFAAEAEDVCRQLVRDVYTELAAPAQATSVPLVNAWPKIQSVLKDDHPITPYANTLLDRWERILAVPPGVRHVGYTSDALRPDVLAAFGSARPGRLFVRYNTPDVLIAAASPQAIQRGDYQLILGELHLCVNTLKASLFVNQHPSPAELVQAMAADNSTPRVVAISPKPYPGPTVRTNNYFSFPQDFRLAFSYDACYSLDSQTLPIGALVIEDLDGELVIRTRDGQHCFDITTFFADFIASQITNPFEIIRPAAHNPRLTIDRLVISREAWCFPTHELAFAHQKDEAERFIAARRWAQSQGLPRFVFAKTPIERKPFYVDFDSPILVNIFAKYIRRTKDQLSADALITLTEMLPDPSQLWLLDAQNRRYTSELRIVVVDLETD